MQFVEILIELAKDYNKNYFLSVLTAAFIKLNVFSLETANKSG